MSRPTSETGEQFDVINEFDFGEPEVIPVEITEGKYIYLKEPCAEDLIQISEINDDDKLSEIEATLQTICVLHMPTNGGKKLTMKDAKKLTARQLKKIGEAMGSLLGSNE
jgi:hypothetical protein